MNTHRNSLNSKSEISHRARILLSTGIACTGLALGNAFFEPTRAEEHIAPHQTPLASEYVSCEDNGEFALQQQHTPEPTADISSIDTLYLPFVLQKESGQQATPTEQPTQETPTAAAVTPTSTSTPTPEATITITSTAIPTASFTPEPTSTSSPTPTEPAEEVIQVKEQAHIFIDRPHSYAEYIVNGQQNDIRFNPIQEITDSCLYRDYVVGNADVDPRKNGDERVSVPKNELDPAQVQNLKECDDSLEEGEVPWFDRILVTPDLPAFWPANILTSDGIYGSQVDYDFRVQEEVAFVEGRFSNTKRACIDVVGTYIPVGARIINGSNIRAYVIDRNEDLYKEYFLGTFSTKQNFKAEFRLDEGGALTIYDTSGDQRREIYPAGSPTRPELTLNWEPGGVRDATLINIQPYKSDITIHFARLAVKPDGRVPSSFAIEQNASISLQEKAENAGIYLYMSYTASRYFTDRQLSLLERTAIITPYDTNPSSLPPFPSDTELQDEMNRHKRYGDEYSYTLNGQTMSARAVNESGHEGSFTIANIPFKGDGRFADFARIKDVLLAIQQKENSYAVIETGMYIQPWAEKTIEKLANDLARLKNAGVDPSRIYISLRFGQYEYRGIDTQNIEEYALQFLSPVTDLGFHAGLYDVYGLMGEDGSTDNAILWYQTALAITNALKKKTGNASLGVHSGIHRHIDHALSLLTDELLSVIEPENTDGNNDINTWGVYSPAFRVLYNGLE